MVWVSINSRICISQGFPFFNQFTRICVLTGLFFLSQLTRGRTIFSPSPHPWADTGNAKTMCVFMSLLFLELLPLYPLSFLSRNHYLPQIPTQADCAQTFFSLSELLLWSHKEQLIHLLSILILMQWLLEAAHSNKGFRQMHGYMANATNDWQRKRNNIHLGNLQKHVLFDDILKEKWNLSLEEKILGYFRSLNTRKLCVLLWWV